MPPTQIGCLPSQHDRRLLLRKEAQHAKVLPVYGGRICCATAPKTGLLTSIVRGGLIRTATGEVVVHRDFDANVIAMKHQIARSHHANNPPGNSINAGQWRLSLKS